jgi:hypothetical protein
MKNKKQKREYSKQLIADVRILLWVITLGGLYLAWLCIDKGFLGSLPWVSAMVGLPWTAHGAICSFYLNMAKSDHRTGGITYEKAKANNFKDFTIVNNDDESGSCNSPKI